LGELRVRYTRARIYSEFPGEKSVEPYGVVAEDAEGVVILACGFWDEDKEKI
jgi:hypothetical protein